MKNQIIQGNCVDVMSRLPADLVDLTITSPPYDDLRSYEGYTFSFSEIANQLYRISKPGGVVVWIVGDASVKGSETGTSFKQALYFKEIGFRLHDTMIYKKKNPVPLVHNRYQPSFEYMLVLSKGKPKTFHPIKVLAKYGGKREFHGTKRTRKGEKIQPSGYGRPIKKFRLKHNVWTYKVGYLHSSKDRMAYDHPAIFPEALARDHIYSWSRVGDLVFDPMCGSGTTCKMAMLLKRNYIGIDISKKYCQIAKRRIAVAIEQIQQKKGVRKKF